MHRGRFNHLRHEHENDGLQQVLQVPASAGGAPMGSTPSPLRKTTYTRTELIQRSPMASAGNRSKRFGGSNSANRAPGNATSVPADGTGSRRVMGTRGIFLPRVARLAGANNNNNINNSSNNNSNIGKSLLTRSKSPFKKKLLATEKSARPAKLPQQQQELPEPPELPQQQQSQLSSSGSSNSSSNSNSSSSSSDLRKIKLAQAFRLPDEQNKSFVYLCKPVKKVKELLMVRPLRHSDDDVNKQLQLGDEAAETEAATADGVDDADRDVVGDVDADNYSDLLSWCSSTHRQMLPTSSSPSRQLELDRLPEPVPELEAAAAASAEPELPAEQRKLDMELVCQNIPTLQREIKLLQLLGEKLEATLRASNNNNNNNDNNSKHNNNNSNDSQDSNGSNNNLTDNSIFYTPRSLLTLSVHEPLPIVQCGWRRVEQTPLVWQRARIDYHARCFGYVREYRIETKTLTELKSSDESQWFYMPLAAGGGMQRTSFRLLRENPNVLLQQLRPLTPARPFNLLEQDPMFFNSMAGYWEAAQPPLEQLLPRESGGGGLHNRDQLPFTFMPYTRLSVGGQSAINWSGDEMKQPLLPAANEASCSDSGPLRPKRTKLKSLRRGNRRPVPPLKLQGRELEPRLQAQLLKSVLVGIVQVALFLVLVMAFTYPDVRC